MPEKEKKKTRKTVKEFKELQHDGVDALEKINSEVPKDKAKKVEQKLILDLYFKPLEYNNNVYVFVYNDNIKYNASNNLLSYSLHLKSTLKEALNIPDVITAFQTELYICDRFEQLPENTRKLLPRYVKSKRLEWFYEYLVDFGLELIHRLYWEEFTSFSNNKPSRNSIEECIKKVTPMILEMKSKLENQVIDELRLNDDEKRILKDGSNYKYKN